MGKSESRRGAHCSGGGVGFSGRRTRFSRRRQGELGMRIASHGTGDCPAPRQRRRLRPRRRLCVIMFARDDGYGFRISAAARVPVPERHGMRGRGAPRKRLSASRSMARLTPTKRYILKVCLAGILSFPYVYVSTLLLGCALS